MTAGSGLRVGSLFSGIGGLDLGLERAGMTIMWQCEIDKDARRVLGRWWPNVPCHENVETLNGRQLPAVDVLCGGFPCQDVSLAGRRAGLAGKRSGLFHEFMRVVGEIAPTWVLVENVAGLLSSNGGRDMGVVLGVLADLGYGWAYRVLDAQYFGVAQRRRRVFIVGCAGGRAHLAAQVLFEPESCSGDPPPGREAGEIVADTLGGGSGRRGFCDDLDRSGAFIPVNSRCLMADGQRLNPETETLIAFHLTQDPISGSDVTPAMSTGSGGGGCATLGVAYENDGSITRTLAERPVVNGGHQLFVASFAEDVRGEVRSGADLSMALSTGGGKPGQGYPAVQVGMVVRRLIPLECERLQGFPDGWTEGCSDSARYRLLGNAVCVPVAEWIGRRIMTAWRLPPTSPKLRNA